MLSTSGDIAFVGFNADGNDDLAFVTFVNIGAGRYFGGMNAVEFNANGTLTGYADPRRTNVAAGY